MKREDEARERLRAAAEQAAAWLDELADALDEVHALDAARRHAPSEDVTPGDAIRAIIGM